MTHRLSRSIATLALAAAAASAQGALVFHNAANAGANAATRSAWLTSVGITSAQHFVDFETGYSNNQNLSGNLFAGNLEIMDTSGASTALIRTGAGVINGSNTVGQFTLTHNEAAWLQFDFAVTPIDYFGGLDIDQAGSTVRVTFEGGATQNLVLDTTATGGDSAEFFGIFRNDQARIVKIEIDASGDGLWGIDNLEYGRVPEPGSLLLAGLALAALAGARRRR